MKLPLSPLAYMILVGSVYLIAGLVNFFVYEFAKLEYIQLVWLVVLSLPVFVPMRKIVRGSPLWRF
jgi:hypothetical protein